MRFSETVALERAEELIQRVKTSASQISVVIVSDTAKDLEKRPALKATGFLERMISDARLSEIVSEYHRHSIAARIVLGFEEFIREAAAGTLFPSQSPIKAVLDMTEGGSHKDGFGYARRSTGALVCKLFGFTYLHANAYAAAIARHKHHQTMLMESAGIPVPKCWSFTPDRGWLTETPEDGQKVLCKSTYEGWSIGVSDNTVGPYNRKMLKAIKELAAEIGQPVCVQEFIEGPELYCLLLADKAIHSLGVAEVYASRGPKKDGDYLEFKDHCLTGGMLYRPPTVAAGVIDDVVKHSKHVNHVLEMSGLTRIDFRIKGDRTPVVIDIADNPGTSPASALAYILQQSDFPLADIDLLILGVGLRDVRYLDQGGQN